MTYNLKFGEGAYTYSEVANILQMPYQRVYFWIKKYWEDIFAKSKEANFTYIQNFGNFECISFFTLIEINIMELLKKANVKHKVIIKAYLEFSKKYNTNHPFTNQNILENLNFDRNNIYDSNEKFPEVMDGVSQIVFEFIKDFTKKLEYDEKTKFVNKFWPRGKESCIVCDPNHSFGTPIISGTNIKADTIYSLYQGEEKPSHIAKLYDITEKQVQDAIEFCKKKVA